MDQLEKLASDITNQSFELNAQAIKLDVVQGSIYKLLDRVDEIVHNGWHEERAAAKLSIIEIRNTLRLIDMAFESLNNEMQQTVKELDATSTEAFDLICKREK